MRPRSTFLNQAQGMSKAQLGLALVKQVERRVLNVRGHPVMLDTDLAELYQVGVKVLNKAVKRNRARFPSDFMFRLTERDLITLRSQIVTAKIGRGGRRSAPYAFTELGACPSQSMGRAHGACEARSRREEESMRHIGDDEQRRDRQQPPCALRAPAARRHLRRCRSSTMSPIACVAAPCIYRRGARNAAHALTRTGSPGWRCCRASCGVRERFV